MTAAELLARATQSPDDTPPDGLTPLLRALWRDACGDWNGAHQIAQDDDGRDAAWVHAYLHRKEGDVGNAEYWYGRARRSAATGSFEDEWYAIASALLGVGDTAGRA
jgi:hypothetical protein